MVFKESHRANVLNLVVELLQKHVPDALLVRPNISFSEAGLSSLGAVAICRALSESLGEKVPVSALFGFPTPAKLSQAIMSGQLNSGVNTKVKSHANEHPIAVVGMGLRLASCDSPDNFWDLLSSGQCAVGSPPEASRKCGNASGLP